MTFVYILKTVLKKWIGALSHNGLGTQLVRQETQATLLKDIKDVQSALEHCCKN
jgi:hypothetical protein